MHLRGKKNTSGFIRIIFHYVVGVFAYVPACACVIANVLMRSLTLNVCTIYTSFNLKAGIFSSTLTNICFVLEN